MNYSSFFALSSFAWTFLSITFLSTFGFRNALFCGVLNLSLSILDDVAPGFYKDWFNFGFY